MGIRLTSRGNETTVVSKYFRRFELNSEELFSVISENMKRSGLVCSQAIVNCPNRFKSVDTDGKVLYISEKGLCNIYVTCCSLGDYTQMQVIFRPILKGHRFDEAKNSLQYSMMNHYKYVMLRCINDAIDMKEGLELLETDEDSVTEA